MTADLEEASELEGMHGGKGVPLFHAWCMAAALHSDWCIVTLVHERAHEQRRGCVCVCVCGGGGVKKEVGEEEI